MEQKLSESLEAAACGFSTGLMYSPGASAPVAELERLCRVVARHGKTYATHMRSYGDFLVEAVEEQLQLVRRTGCRLQRGLSLLSLHRGQTVPSMTVPPLRTVVLTC